VNLSRFSGAALVLALGLAACGGGGGSSSAAPPANVQPPQQFQSTAVQYSIVAPMPGTSSSSSHQRRPQFLSPNTGSVSFLVTSNNGHSVTQPPTVVNLSSGCTANTPIPGEETCTATSQAPVGTDIFLVTAYQATDGTGTPLSQNTVTQSITTGVNNISITLNPVVASMAFTPSTNVTQDGVAGNGPVIFNAKDASGAVIVGPQQFLTTAGANDTITIVCGAHLLLKQNDGTTNAALSIGNASQNTIAKGAYDGVSLGVNGGNIVCTATDTSGTPLTATFTLFTSPNGTINWTVN
jgi:hypothetical protein